MFLGRLGSLNSLEKTSPSRFWQAWLGGNLPSADSLGRIASLLDPDGIRALNRDIYSRLKDAKALPAPAHGLMALAIDGHESHATYRRHCDGCLERVIHAATGDRVQYYHRNVTAMLLAGDATFLLDAETQVAGEDEVACALRLLDRVLTSFPRAFDVVLADALYADSRFFNFVRGRGKHVLTVLKDNRRDLVKDSLALCELTPPREIQRGKKTCRVWDVEDCTSWSQVDGSVRVVRSHETGRITRQLDGRSEELISEWLWVTTIPPATASSSAVVELGHARWAIENHGFNETTNHWWSDHVYKHSPNAILCLWLLCMVAVNVFRVFFRRNLKPAIRLRLSMLDVGRLISAELYASLDGPTPAPRAQSP